MSDDYDNDVWLGYMDCCGIKELYPIDDCTIGEIMRAVRDQATSEGRQHCAFLVFSSITAKGTKLAEFIQKKRYGSVVTLPSRINPNSGNRLKVWLWAPNLKKIRKDF